MTERDANRYLVAGRRVPGQTVNDTTPDLEATQRMTPVERRDAAYAARMLYERHKLAQPIMVEERRAYVSDPEPDAAFRGRVLNVMSLIRTVTATEVNEAQTASGYTLDAIARKFGLLRTPAADPWPNGYPHDFRDLRPRGHLSQHERNIQDLRIEED